MKDNDQRIFAMLAHLLGLFTSFIGPLVIYLVMKDKKEKLAIENAKHALNFQISLIIYYAIAVVLMIILIGILLAWAIGVFGLVMAIIASIKAYEGEIYTYPLEIHFIK